MQRRALLLTFNIHMYTFYLNTENMENNVNLLLEIAKQINLVYNGMELGDVTNEKKQFTV